MGADDVDGDGCDDIVSTQDNVVLANGVTFQLGDSDDIAAVGDWDCDGVSTPRLLRRSTGEVFEFAWATPGRRAAGRSLGRTSDAIDLLRSDDPANAGCDILQIVRTDGTAVPL